MTTPGYAVGNCPPAVHSRCQKAQSGNPAIRAAGPGAGDACEKNSQRLQLALLDSEAGRPQAAFDPVIESETAEAPAFEEGGQPVPASEKWDALFSLFQGEAQGDENQRMQKMLKILAEKAAAPKEQGENREIGHAPSAR